MEFSTTRVYLIRLCLALLLLPSLLSAEQARNNTAVTTTVQVGQVADFQLPSFYSLRLQDAPSALSSALDFPVLLSVALLPCAMAPQSSQIAFLSQTYHQLACRVFAARAPPMIA